MSLYPNMKDEISASWIQREITTIQPWGTVTVIEFDGDNDRNELSRMLISRGWMEKDEVEKGENQKGRIFIRFGLWQLWLTFKNFLRLMKEK